MALTFRDFVTKPKKTLPFFCIECFYDCKNAAEFVEHKDLHHHQPVKKIHTEGWMEMRATMILKAEYFYFWADFQPIGLLYDGDNKELYVHAVKEKIFPRSERPKPSTHRCIGDMTPNFTENYKTGRIPVFARTF